jgi:hypothetical protein
MTTMKKTAAGAVLGGALLAAGGLGLAHAAPPAAQSVVGDGKVNVTVTAGNEEIGVLQDVSLANAQALAVSACSTAGITTEQLQALDNDGTPLPTTCVGLEGGPTFTFVQNTPGNTENAPGQQRMTPSSPTSPTSPTPSR